MSQISNWTKMHNSKYTYLLKVKTYAEQLKRLLAKGDNSPNLEMFKKVFRFFYQVD